MPGHIKLTKTGQADPDPTEFILPSMEMKRNDQQKVYDAKKSVWIPDPKSGGFREGLLESGDLEDPASKCVVAVAHEKFTHKAVEVGKVNPPKFEKCEDMVNLTFLNDASVFWNLKTRYQAKMIHTYSGLFVVVVNPYKRYPIYTHRVCKIYLDKNLSTEIKDIMDQITEGGRSIHEIDKIRKRLEAEKMELEAALSEAEGALEQEENKVLRCQLELTTIKQEIERRLAMKEEEFLTTKKNFTKALEGLQMALETETKGKVEALRMKKKLEMDILDLETALEHANSANAESQKNIKSIQLRLRDVQVRLEDESKAKAIAQDDLIAADRRCHANQNALEEARTLLEQADRNRRNCEAELADTNETLGDMTCTNQALVGAKSKCEQEMNSLSHDLDEMSAEASMSEDKAQRAMVDAARLADELRCEQDVAMSVERDNKLLEAQTKDAQNRLDEAEQNALKSGKKAMSKMDTRIRELSSELDAENRRLADAQKNFRRSERVIKELTFSQDEDKKNHERMQGLIEQLQAKIKSYKKQIEEAEEIAALNLAKYRQVSGSLIDSNDRADLHEQALAKMKAQGRSSRASSLAPM